MLIRVLITFFALSFSSALAAITNLSISLTGSSGLRLIGGSSSQFGYSVANAGDFNKDSVNDFIVGAPMTEFNGFAQCGAAFIVLGSNSLASEIDITSFGSDSGGMRIFGAAANDQAGLSVGAAGDVNQDTYDDVLVGAGYADPASRTDAGTVYVIFGRAGPYVDLLLANLAPGSLGFSVFAPSTLAYLGLTPGSVRGDVGDVNGDGIDDFLVGARNFLFSGKTSAGSAWLLHGKASSETVTNIDLGAGLVPSGQPQIGSRFGGANVGDFTGYAVCGVGDVNGDGRNDLLVSAPQADPLSRSNAGIVYLIYGTGANLHNNFNLASSTYTNSMLRYLGVTSTDLLGVAASGAGDVNDDGFADFLLGAPLADPLSRDSAGIVYVIFGNATMPTGDMDLTNFVSGTAGYRIFGAVTSTALGSALAAVGDVNQDGVDDFLVGGTNSAHILYGCTVVRTADVDLADFTNVWTFTGLPSGSRLGTSVDGGRDLTGDGIPDLLLGAYGEDVNPADGGAARADAGAVYLLAGPFIPPTPAPSAMPSAVPSAVPSAPTVNPTAAPTTTPTKVPTAAPTLAPSTAPTATPTEAPTVAPTLAPSTAPTTTPTEAPTAAPTLAPSAAPTTTPTAPTAAPTTATPTAAPTTAAPSVDPTVVPTTYPTVDPTVDPTINPTAVPTAPTAVPTSMAPTARPTEGEFRNFQIKLAVEQTVFFMTEENYNAQQKAYNETIQYTVAAAVDGVTPERVTDIYVKSISPAAGLRGAKLRSAASKVAAEVESCSLSYQVTVYDPLLTFEMVREQLIQAAALGQMDADLRHYAAVFQAQHLENGTFSAPLVTEIVDDPNSDTDESSSSKAALSVGAIVGIVVGGVTFLVLLFFLAVVCTRRRKSNQAVAASE